MDSKIQGCSSQPCIFKVALDGVTLPVFIQDQAHLLYANPMAVSVMGAPAGADLTGRAVNDFMHTDSVEASEERRRLALQQGASLRSIPIKGRMVDGTIRRAITDGERIADAAARPGIVHVLREVDGQPLMAYRAPASGMGGAPVGSAACLHEAAFEAAALPLLLHDGVTFLAANAQARALLGADPRGMAPGSFTHEQSREAARERRELTLGKGQALRDVYVKLNTMAARDQASTVSATVDGTPVLYGDTRMVVLTVKDARR